MPKWHHLSKGLLTLLNSIRIKLPLALKFYGAYFFFQWLLIGFIFFYLPTTFFIISLFFLPYSLYLIAKQYAYQQGTLYINPITKRWVIGHEVIEVKKITLLFKSSSWSVLTLQTDKKNMRPLYINRQTVGEPDYRALMRWLHYSV